MNFKESLTNHNLFIRHIRYVDNRLIFGDKRLQQLHPYEVLLGEGFYGRPIVLETEPDQEFLGFMLETPPLTPSSTSSAPAPSPTIPAAAASSSSPDPTGPATYTSDLSAQGAPPFPPAETSWEHRRPQTFFTEQTVHQVFFEVFTFDNERRELWINEIDFRGYSRLREPEQYFYSLTGDDAYARHTSDYRRVFFNIPTHSTSTTLIIMDITTTTFIQLQQPHLQLHHQHRQPPLRPILQHRQHNSKNVSLHHLLRDPTQLRWLAAYLERWPRPALCLSHWFASPRFFEPFWVHWATNGRVGSENEATARSSWKNNPAPAGCVCVWNIW